jgi:hypothetical protein
MPPKHYNDQYRASRLAARAGLSWDEAARICAAFDTFSEEDQAAQAASDLLGATYPGPLLWCCGCCIYKWLGRFQANGIAGLERQAGSGRRREGP